MSDELVTIAFRTKDGKRAHIHLPWSPHRRLRQYLRDPALRKFALVARVMRVGLMNEKRRKLKLNHVPEAGDLVFVGRR
jgi:hypothetical protein